eukprot:scaffold9095_cov125-Isochrysis_galbana.AAC.5
MGRGAVGAPGLCMPTHPGLCLPTPACPPGLFPQLGGHDLKIPGHCAGGAARHGRGCRFLHHRRGGGGDGSGHRRDPAVSGAVHPQAQGRHRGEHHRAGLRLRLRSAIPQWRAAAARAVCAPKGASAQNLQPHPQGAGGARRALAGPPTACSPTAPRPARPPHGPPAPPSLRVRATCRMRTASPSGLGSRSRATARA